MDFSSFDVRKYRVLPVRQGYGEWVHSYEQTVEDEMDLRLLESIETVSWPGIRSAVDLACGTGRTGVWLRRQGVQAFDGVDITPEMLARAQDKGVYRTLYQADITDTGLDAGNYDLAIEALADEHLADLAPLYREAARLTSPEGTFVLVGYHPHFLMQGIITHFHRADGEAVAIESYVHLLSDHVKAAHAAGWTLAEMDEGIIDEAWLAKKPKWAQYRNRPVSFAMVWQKQTER